MNEKELDQILKQALRPEVSQDEVEVWERPKRMESEEPMNKNQPKYRVRYRVAKTAVAIAACLALIVGIGYGKLPMRKSVQKTKQSAVESENTPESILNSFVVKVSAAEVKRKNQKEENSSQEKSGEKDSPQDLPTVYAAPCFGSVWDGDVKKKYEVSYCIDTPITCEGKNIETITYTINKGYFQIESRKDSKYLVKGETGKKKVDAGFLSSTEGTEEREKYVREQYRSFTVRADEKPEEKFVMSIVDDKCRISEEGYNGIFNSNYKLEKQLKGFNEAIGKTVITCTATYKDGSTQSVDVKVGFEIMTNEEAGMDEKKADKNEKDVFTTFEVG